MTNGLRAAVLSPDGTVHIDEVAGDLEWMQQTVGGPIQIIPVPDDIASVYINEEAALIGPDGLPFNETATLLVAGIGLLPGDYLRGPVIVVGPADENGEDTSLPPAIEARLHELQRWQAELEAPEVEVGPYSFSDAGAQYRHDTISVAHTLYWSPVGDAETYANDPTARLAVIVVAAAGCRPTHLGVGADVQGHPLYGVDLQEGGRRVRLYSVAVTIPGADSPTMVPVAALELPVSTPLSTPSTWTETDDGALQAVCHDEAAGHALPLRVERIEEGRYRWAIGEQVSSGQEPSQLQAALAAELAATRLGLQPGSPDSQPATAGLDLA